MSLTDQTERAEAAALVKRHGLMDQILADLEADYMTKLMACDSKDDLGRFRFTEAIKIARAFSRHLDLMIENGKVARHELDAMNKPDKGWFR